MITIPTTLGGRRVACLFPCIGGEEHDRFVEATVVLTDDNLERPTFTVERFRPTSSGGSIYPIGEPTTSFATAIREARKSQGWG